jgi:hypothetical protein
MLPSNTVYLVKGESYGNQLRNYVSGFRDNVLTIFL